MRAAQPGARRITPMFVSEFTTQYENLFTTNMGMSVESFSLRKMHQSH